MEVISVRCTLLAHTCKTLFMPVENTAFKAGQLNDSSCHLPQALEFWCIGR